MNSYQKSALKLSIAVALGVAANAASAALPVDLTGATGTVKAPSIFIKEMPSSTTTLLNGGVTPLLTAFGPLSVRIPFVPSYSVNAANPYYVKLALTGGAKFAVQPTITCATGAGGAGSDSAAGVITVGGVGTNAVTFQIPSGAVLATGAAGLSTGCIASVDSLTISGLGDVNISGTIEYKDGANNVATALTGPYITFKKSISASVSTNSVAATAANATIDVTTGSKKFTAASVQSTTTALVGSISYTVVPQATTASYNSGGTAFTTGALYVSGTNGFSVTIAGPAVGNATTAYLTTTNCAAAPAYSATPSAASVTMTGITATDISAGLTVCLGFSGTTAITEGQITANITKTTETQVTSPDTSVASADIFKLAKNGASTTINFLTNPAGFATFVRFTNPTSFDGNVLVTAINDDGVAGGTVWTFPILKGASQMYSVATIMTKTGVAAATTTPTDGLIGNKFRLVVNADTSALNVQALNVSKDGNSFGQLADK